MWCAPVMPIVAVTLPGVQGPKSNHQARVYSRTTLFLVQRTLKQRALSECCAAAEFEACTAACGLRATLKPAALAAARARTTRPCQEDHSYR